jgi:Caspase domain
MDRLLSPRNTVALILGAHDWSKAGLPKAPSFRRSAANYHRYLISPAPHGLGMDPDLILNLFDDVAPASGQLATINEHVGGLVRERKDTLFPIRDLLIYYVGHGTSEAGRHLQLLVRESTQGIEEQSSINTRDLAHILRVVAPQQRRLLILDCCFSEAAADAFGGMGALDDAVAATALNDLAPAEILPGRGTMLLCSTPRGRTSIGRPNDEETLFTGALLRVLEKGSSHRPALLSFADLRQDIYSQMIEVYGNTAPRPALHQPDQREGDLTQIPAFPNFASRPASKVTSDPQDDPLQSQSRRDEKTKEVHAAGPALKKDDCKERPPELVTAGCPTGVKEEIPLETGAIRSLWIGCVSNLFSLVIGFGIVALAPRMSLRIFDGAHAVYVGSILAVGLIYLWLSRRFRFPLLALAGAPGYLIPFVLYRHIFYSLTIGAACAFLSLAVIVTISMIPSTIFPLPKNSTKVS